MISIVQGLCARHAIHMMRTLVPVMSGRFFELHCTAVRGLYLEMRASIVMFDTLHLRHVGRLTISRLIHLLVCVSTHVSLLLHRRRIALMDLRQERLVTLEGPQPLGAAEAHLVLHLNVLGREGSATKQSSYSQRIRHLLVIQIVVVPHVLVDQVTALHGGPR